MKIFLIIIGLVAVGLIFFLASPGTAKNPTEHQGEEKSMATATLDTATFASGCFWCVEAVFQNLKGVQSVVSGYAGGSVANPSLRRSLFRHRPAMQRPVRLHTTRRSLSYPELLEVFWKTHDPTTLNRQGNDVGTQYRSAIFYHNEEQKKLAEHYKRELDSSGAFDAPIVTEIVPFHKFLQGGKLSSKLF